jgi:hypothetical protein
MHTRLKRAKLQAKHQQKLSLYTPKSLRNQTEKQRSKKKPR